MKRWESEIVGAGASKLFQSHFINQLKLIACFVFSGVNSDAQEKPNILWISVEDISPDLVCNGDVLANTPVLDQLAQ